MKQRLFKDEKTAAREIAHRVSKLFASNLGINRDDFGLEIETSETRSEHYDFANISEFLAQSVTISAPGLCN